MTTAPLAGAAVLFLTDSLTQLLRPGFSDLAPRGAATALIGGPLLLFLLPRVHGRAVPTSTSNGTARHLSRRALALLLLGVAFLVVFLAVLLVGQTDGGWQIAVGSLLSDLLPFRLPRIVVAAGTGAMLGAAGFVMQRVTGNPLASPEVLGVSSGAGAGLTVTLFVFAFPSPLIMIAGMSLGAFVSFLAMIAFARRAGLSADVLLLSGVAISAFCLAIISVVLSQGDMRSYILLTWISGSTNRAGTFEAWTAIISLAVPTAPLFLMTRWFAILPLGARQARSGGLRVTSTRLLLAALAAAMTAISSFLIRQLSLTGQIAPHLSRLRLSPKPRPSARSHADRRRSAHTVDQGYIP